MLSLSVSQIAWTPDLEDKVVPLLREWGVCGVEVTPARVASDPGDPTPGEARSCRRRLESCGLRVSSMQALLYGVETRRSP